MVKNLLKDGALHDNPWERYAEHDAEQDDDDSIGAPLPCQVIFPLATLAESPDLVKGCKEYAVSVVGGDDIAALARFLDGAAFIAVEFPAFSDGRGYSLARMIRRNLKWNGELRAIGNVLADQYAYMLECGFDAFEIDPNRQPPPLFVAAGAAIGMRYQVGDAESKTQDIRRLRHG